MTSPLTSARRIELLNEHQLSDEAIRLNFVSVWKNVMNDAEFLDMCAKEFERKEAAEPTVHDHTTRQAAHFNVETAPPPLSYRF